MTKVKVEIPMEATSCIECGALNPTESKIIDLGGFSVQVQVCKDCKIKKN